MEVLALSGSLRAASENTRVLRAAARIVPADVRVTVYAGLGVLPLFNPDSEFPYPEPVAALRQAIISAQAVVIASPEYAHGISGVMKNALDWMVGNESFVDMPVALVNAAPRAIHAYLALRETVTMMSARVIDAACITLKEPVAGMTVDEIAQHPQHAPMLAGMLRALAMTTKMNG